MIGAQHEGQQTGPHPQADGDAERDHGVDLAAAPRPEGGLALGDDPVGARNLLHAGLADPVEIDEDYRHQHAHDGHREQHPLHERDPEVQLLAEHADRDQVRRGADRRGHAAARAAVRRHQHQRGPVLLRDVRRRLHESNQDTPSGTSIAAVAVLLIHADRPAASSRRRTGCGVGRAPIHFSESTPNATVRSPGGRRGPGQDEAADEQKDGWCWRTA